MSLTLLLGSGVTLYVVACLAYVHRWRGQVRYASLGQYVRKSWPVFAPFNCLLYMNTRRAARGPVLDADYLEGIGVLRARWATIRDEALALHRAGALEATAKPGSAGYHDLGFRTFYKRGWRKFYLCWYGRGYRSAQATCPATLEAVAQVPGIRAAMFSILPPGAELSLHSDPLACSLRYHLGLDTPNEDACFIDVDGVALSWRDGRDFVFDETYPHHVRNGSDRPRLILMCDVERPMHPLGRLVNRPYSLIARAMMVPNTDADARGAITALFARLAPWRARGLDLKARRRRLYLLLKLGLNTLLLAALCGALLALLRLLEVGLVATMR